MNTITIWNKGRRPWTLKNAEGANVVVESQESVQVEEVYGLRMVAAYPKDLTTTGVAAPSLDDIKRREQSLRDREANLDAREKALKEIPESIEKLVDKIYAECMGDGKEKDWPGFCTSKAAELIAAFIDEQNKDKHPGEEKKRAGRPPKADKAE